MMRMGLYETVAESLGNIEEPAYLQGRLIATSHVLAYTISLIKPTPQGRTCVPLLSCISQPAGYTHKEVRNLHLSNEQLREARAAARRHGADESIESEFHEPECEVIQFRKP